MKDIRSLLLVLLSFGLVATWVYHFYDKSSYSRQKTEVATRDSSAIANEVRDSLQKIYSATISSMDLRLDSSRSTSDSLHTKLVTKVNEVNRLKTEISTILKNPKSNNAELAMARQKMNELEEIVKELRNEKSDMELEKKELTNRLDQMTGEVSNLQQNIRRLDEENKSLTEKIKLASVFVASSLHFAAINVMTDKEQETSLARKADKFVASFVLQNNFNEYMSAEIMIVITQPDGNVLQSSTWDSGSFDTKTEGKKNYTRKMRFDYSKGEQKALIFTLEVAKFQKGTYTLQVWHNGILVGEINKTLS
jgi:myosin heavy subunit